MTDHLDIAYRPYPSTVPYYSTGSSLLWYSDDVLISNSGIDELSSLARSPHWQDRIRAELVRSSIRVSLPDQFPVLYERADSPNQTRSQKPRETHWVISPDLGMLEELLPLYQELWDSYTSQWGPQSRRVMEVGLRDGLPPHQVYLPGTTVDQVIAHTMRVHPDMAPRAPKWAKKIDRRDLS